MKKLSIIVPAWNEEKRIRHTLSKLLKFFREDRIMVELIIVTDGCTDDTPRIVRNFKKKYGQIIHLNPSERLGKGGAIIKGFEIASGKIIGFIDADGSTSLRSIKKMIKILQSDERLAGVIASRWINGSKIYKHEPFTRKIASRVFNFVVRILFHFHFRDTQCGAKFFKKNVVKEVLPELGLTDWAFDVELLYRIHKKRFKIKEIPVEWKYKSGSKLNLPKTSLKMFLSVIGLRVKTSKLRSITKIPLIRWIYESVNNI